MADTKHYKILELKRSANKKDLREAYIDLSKVWHPDRFANDDRVKIKAEERSKQINTAYDVLKEKITDKAKPEQVEESEQSLDEKDLAEEVSKAVFERARIRKSHKLFTHLVMLTGLILALVGSYFIATSHPVQVVIDPEGAAHKAFWERVRFITPSDRENIPDIFIAEREKIIEYFSKPSEDDPLSLEFSTQEAVAEPKN